MEKENERIGFMIKVISNTLERNFNRFLKELDLTKPQMDVLFYLQKARERNQKVSQKDLEQFFHISNPTVSVMLDRLEAKQLICRSRSEQDRRIRYICSTPKASELTGELYRIRQQADAEMYRGLDEEQIAQGAQFLKKLMNNLMRKEDSCFDQNSDEAN